MLKILLWINMLKIVFCSKFVFTKFSYSRIRFCAEKILLIIFVLFIEY